MMRSSGLASQASGVTATVAAADASTDSAPGSPENANNIPTSPATPTRSASMPPAPTPMETARFGAAASFFQIRAAARVTPISKTPVSRPM